MVLYSSKDEDFADYIADRLEKDETRKLLLHERDFPIGGGILENINDAFESSRASILILSEAFLESSYCMHEAEMAMESWITKRQKLIPIFKENIEQKKIPAVIDNIMSSITYFEWHRVQTERDEDKFWNKLERALTKPKRKSSLVSSVRKATARLFGRHRGVQYTRLNNRVV
ncbi:toll-like receptor Tollo [Ptychodera flava]|uniref:toll-like receptor Tollo n=1 Tax=Ptychodera flava TaxID=63121 RepID=UPI003969F1EE